MRYLNYLVIHLALFFFSLRLQDLCKDCWDRGCAYASSHPSDAPLIIHGRTLCVEDEDMPCDTIWQMNAIIIPAPTAGFPKVEDVEAALKMSQSTKEQAPYNESHDKEDFKARMFSNLLSLISRSITKAALPSHHLFHLVLSMIHGSKTEKLRASRGKEMLKSITDSLRGLLNEKDMHTSKVVVLLRALSSLVTKKTNIEQGPLIKTTATKEKDKHKSKTDPRFVCDVHKVPAVRRRCSSGVHKDRRFYGEF